MRRIAARAESDGNKKKEKKSVLHMATSPRWRRRILFYFCDFFWIRHRHRRSVPNLRLIVTILVVAAVPVCAQAQKQSAAVTKRDAQKVVRIIGGDKAKTRPYCDMVKLGEQIEQANDKKDNKTVDELSEEIGRATKTGSRICRINGWASEQVRSPKELVAVLDNLCTR